MRFGPVIPAVMTLARFATSAATGSFVNIEEVGRQPVESTFPAGSLLRMDLCSSGPGKYRLHAHAGRLTFTQAPAR
jgi:hypothetical protein